MRWPYIRRRRRRRGSVVVVVVVVVGGGGSGGGISVDCGWLILRWLVWSLVWVSALVVRKRDGQMLQHDVC